MSARDSESGSSTYRGGSGNAGGLGNGGIGGGMGGCHRGGGAGYNGGIGSRTGMTTGKDWYGNTAFGRAGGNVQAYGTRDARSLARAGMGPTVGSFGNFRTPTGQAMFAGSPVQGQSFYGRNMGQALSQAQRAQAAFQQAQRPASVPGLLGGAPTAAGAPAYDPLTSVQPPEYNPLVDVQPGLPPLRGVPNAQLQYTFGPRVPQWGSYASAPSITDMGPVNYEGGYGFGTAHANSVVNSPAYGYGAAGTIGNYAGSNWGGKGNRN